MLCTIYYGCHKAITYLALPLKPDGYTSHLDFASSKA